MFGVHAELFQPQAPTSTWNDFLIVGGNLVGMRSQRSDGTITTRYFTQDHLGSIAVIADENGNAVERLSYDAWGKRRLPDGRDDQADSITSQTTRGFTGQENLDAVGLVHLNGRVGACPWAGQTAGPEGPAGRPHDERRSVRARSDQRADVEPVQLRHQQPAVDHGPERLLLPRPV